MSAAWISRSSRGQSLLPSHPTLLPRSFRSLSTQLSSRHHSTQVAEEVGGEDSNALSRAAECPRLAPFFDRIHRTRNIGISAHIDSGKTTLTERVLYYTGRIKAIHEVRGRDGVGAKMDFMELEREKGITIQSAATYTKWNDCDINLIDTPGHVDFTIEVERALRVLDGAVLVLCGVSGVQSQSLTVDRQMKRYNVPRITFINKLDRKGASPWRIIEQVRKSFGIPAAAVQIPMGLEDALEGVIDIINEEALHFEGLQGHVVRRTAVPDQYVEEMRRRRRELVEALADVDDAIADKFLMEEPLSAEEIVSAIRRTTIARSFTPVFLGSALKNVGVQSLLDGVCHFLPNPTEASNFALVVTDVRGEKEVDKRETKTHPEESLVALAFKLEDGKYGQLTYLRIYQGTLKKGDVVINSRSRKRSKVPRLVRMHAAEMQDIDSASAGDICAIFGMECASGDTFVDGQGDMLTMETLFVPEPVMSLSIEPLKKDSAAFPKAIGRFTREDPTLRFHTDVNSNQRIISGMGELHLDIYVERLKREYNCECKTGQPRVNYRETITSESKFDYLHKKQSGGSGQYAGVTGYIEAVGEGASENEFDNRTVGNNIPPTFIPAIEKGFKDAVREGTLTGCPVEGVRFVLTDGKSHVVDSNEIAFRTAAVQAFRQAFPNAGATVLEPIMNLEVSVPVENQGSVIAAVTKRRGYVMNATTLGTTVTLQMEVALGEMFGFSTELRSLTQGKGEFAMEYIEHREAPVHIVNKLAEEYAQRRATKLEAKK